MAQKIYFCPKCKSVDVKYIFELGNLFGVIPKMHCEKCGFEMSNFPVMISGKKIKSKRKKK